MTDAERIAELEAKLAEAERERDKAREDWAAQVRMAEQGARETARVLAGAESREEALRGALTHSVDWFWGPKSEDLTATHERVATEFYAETGIVAPGKDVPAAMNAPWTEEQRHAAWNAWITRKREALEVECRAALAAGVRDEPPGPPSSPDRCACGAVTLWREPNPCASATDPLTRIVHTRQGCRAALAAGESPGPQGAQAVHRCARCGGIGEGDADFHCATCYREMESRAAKHDPKHAEKEAGLREWREAGALAAGEKAP